MEIMHPENWPQFYTATIQHWNNLLADEKYKSVITNSLGYLVQNRKIKLNGFVVMNNHIHFIWQATAGNNLKDIQTGFKKFSSQQFVILLRQDKELNQYAVSSADRKHHFWKRNSLSVELFTPAVFQQKLDYIHNNPVVAGICEYPEQYKYSSASFYEKGIDEFGILEHYAGS